MTASQALANKKLAIQDSQDSKVLPLPSLSKKAVSPSSSQLAVATFHQNVDRSLEQPFDTAFATHTQGQLDSKVTSEVMSRQTAATPGTASFDRQFHVPAMNQNMEQALVSTLDTPPVTTVTSTDASVVSRKSDGNGVDTCADKIVTAFPSSEVGSVAGGTPPVNAFESGTQNMGKCCQNFGHPEING